MILDHFSDSAMSVLNDVKEQWLRHHVIFSGLAIPDRIGRFSAKQLEGVVLQEQIKGGWTILTLLDGSREVAQARYRWTDELKLEWDPMSHTSPSRPTSTP